MRSAFAIAVAAVLLLAGCTDPTGAPTGSETIEESDGGIAIVEGDSYASLADFKDAFVASGQDCTDFVQDDAIESAAESGWCDQLWGLSTYDSVDDRNAVLELNVSGIEHLPFIIGPNWLLTAVESRSTPDLAAVQPTLGGLLWDYTQPIPE